MKFRRICEIFPSSENISGNLIHVFEHQIHGLIQQQRPQHSAQGREQIGDAKFHRLGFHFAGFHFGQVQKIVHQVQQIARGSADVFGLLLLLGRQFAVRAIQQQAAQRQNGVQRRAELVAHIGQKPRLQFVGAAQVIGFFVQFRIQRHHAAIGVFQFPIQPGELDLPGADLLQRVEQLLILMLQFLKCVLRALARQQRRQARQILRLPNPRCAWGAVS